jgi:hypothetical protein
MILLTTTITFSIDVLSFLYFLAVLTGMLIVVVVNFLLYSTFNDMTNNEKGTLSLNQKQHNMFVLFGVLLIPLFKNTITDTREFINLDKKRNDIKYAMSMWGGTERKDELLVIERKLKLLRLKYSKKNFVVRKVFTIFV